MKLVQTFGLGLLFLSGMAVMNTPESAQAVPVRERPDNRPLKRVDWKTDGVSFYVQEKPWRELLEWFAEQSGTRFHAKCQLPNGGYAVGSHERNLDNLRVYNLEQIFDIINEELSENHDRVLIRDDSKLVMVASYDPDSWPPIPYVRREDLGKSHAKTEIIGVKVSLGPEYGPDIAPQIKKYLGKFGNVVAANEVGDFVFQGPASELRLVLYMTGSER